MLNIDSETLLVVVVQGVRVHSSVFEVHSWVSEVILEVQSGSLYVLSVPV